MRVAVSSVAKTPKLQECSPASLLQAVLVAAEVGLEPGGALGHAYLVPFKGSCTLIIGYRGLIELAYRSGEVASISAEVRHERDTWKHSKGFAPNLIHEPFDGEDPGPVRSVYCIVTLKSGARLLDVMSFAEVEQIRKRSRSGDSGPWVTDWSEMARKTVVRRALKYAPLSSERLGKALEVDDSDYIDGQVVGQVLEAPAAALDLKARVKARAADLATPAEIPAEVPAP
jgi:recombination protein RecT